MNLLLDTHVLLWAASSPGKLSAPATQLLADPDNSLWVSAASLWEVTIKQSLNRPDFDVDPTVLRAGLLANGYLELAIEGRHCLALSALPVLHHDPFDRMLLAQAISEGMMLMTADRKLAQYDGPIRVI